MSAFLNVILDLVHEGLVSCPACPPAAAAAAPPIENMVKFRYEPTNGRTKKAILGVGYILVEGTMTMAKYTSSWQLSAAGAAKECQY